MSEASFLRLLTFAALLIHNTISGTEWYNSAAYTECKASPEAPLYGGGILPDLARAVETNNETAASSPSYVLDNLATGTHYAFSCWVKIRGSEEAVVKARLATGNATIRCIGTALARSGCWSFLKGGFVLDSPPSDTSVLYFKNAGNRTAEISIASASLQPFTVEQWRAHQEENIRRTRKRVAAIHVVDSSGKPVSQAAVAVELVSKGFPLGSAIANTILDNPPYQAWFLERFNTAVFENELKWYATEPEPGQENYTTADQMLAFAQANGIALRGHNIFWEDPIYVPSWVRNLTGDPLERAVESRVSSLLGRYKGEFTQWDVNNEMLHYNFYEQRLGKNASARLFDAARRADPLATLFMNEFNVVETCDDDLSTVDAYVLRLNELVQRAGAPLAGVGLQGHFSRPNIPLMRAVLDKLATLGMPVWLTEVDISKKIDLETQGNYLEQVLREGFGHPAVEGIMLWTALHGGRCYQMCLTDGELRSLPAGSVVDKLLGEWQTRAVTGTSDEYGTFSFEAFLGEYRVRVISGNRSAESTLSLPQGNETKRLSIRI
ncbi:glycosyl hydrolase family 10 protein [Wolffia australiana]